ncbi:MAG: DUF2510 domain-containing protein [Catenulispora sp.]|nr:DUF2510 domain-containing protein [Catenulispora sp.]
MESSPRPGYYPDPSVPGYIRYWDGSKWVAGTSKPMPGGVGEAEAKEAGHETQSAPGGQAAQAGQSGQTKTAAFPAPSLADVNFDDLLPPEYDESESESQSPALSTPRPASGAPSPSFPPEPEPERQAPAFPTPPSMSELSFDAPQVVPQPAPVQSVAAPGFPPPPIVGPAGMGISLSGPGVPQAAPSRTPAQVAATSQSLRIRLLRPDGKPFDGPEITTGPKADDAPAEQARGGYDNALRGPKKQAPKVVVKSGPAARAGHLLAVLAISAIGIVPLAYLLLQSVHDREDKLAARITVPTKMNVLDGTSEGYLGGMVVVLLVVALVYWTRLKRRRMR